MWFGLYADSVAILSGLPLIVPADILTSSQHAQPLGEIGSLFAAASPTPLANAAPARNTPEAERRGAAESRGTPSGVFGKVESFARFVLNPFVKLWQQTNLGFMSIGLAFTQAGLGLMCLRGTPPGKAVSKKPMEFFRERRIPFLVFVALDLGLGTLAAFRAYERGSGDAIWAPTALSCLIGLVMPFIQAYMLHLFSEDFSAFCGPISTVASSLIVFLVACLALTVWAGLLAAAFMVAGAFLAAGILLFGLLIVYLWSVETWGEFLRKLTSWRRRKGEHVAVGAPPAGEDGAGLSMAA
jgi:hypothetical protein